MTVEAFLARLSGVRRNGSGWRGLCPAHPDRNPSLAIHVRCGKILIFCHAGCSLEAVLTALGMEAHELSLGANDSKRRIVATYDHVDEQGKLLYQIVRLEPKDFRQRRPDGGGGWIWNLGDCRRVPYHLPEIIAASSVVVVEGNKDADTAAKLGLAATSSKHWRPEFCEYLRGKSAVIIGDADDAGREIACEVAISLAGKIASLKLLELPGSAKDLTEWVEGGGTRAMHLKVSFSCSPSGNRSRKRKHEKSTPGLLRAWPNFSPMKAQKWSH